MNTKDGSRYDGRLAARKKLEFTLFANALALVLQACRYVKARPAKSLIPWIFASLLGFLDGLTFLFPDLHLDLNPEAIINFLARIATSLMRQFETLHVLDLLFLIALAVFTTHDTRPPQPPAVQAESTEIRRKAGKRRRRRKPKPA